MSGRNGPEGRNDTVDQHSDQTTKPTALEAWSQKKREGAKKNRESGRDQLSISTSKNLTDLTRNIFDKGQIIKDRSQLQADFDSGKIDQDVFDKKSARIDKREAMMIKSGGVISPSVAATFRGIDFSVPKTEVVAANLPSKINMQQKEIGTTTMDTNAARERAQQVALKGSGGIDATSISMSQPQNMKSSEIPSIPVQPIYSKLAQQVLAEKVPDTKSTNRLASN